MAMSERERYELYVFIEETFGKHGEAFMNMLTPDLPLRMDHLSSELRGEVSSLRSDVTSQLAGILPKLVVANILAMLAVAGLVLAGVAIA